MELLILGLALGVGAAKRKEVTKAVVKGYMAVSDKTREVTAHLKEDMRDAIEEARYEQDMLAGDAPVVEMDTETERTVLQEETVAELNTEATPASVVAASVEAGRKVQTNLFKGLAKSYLAMTEKTRAAVAQMREEMRDAVEEARFEREQAAAKATAEAAHEVEVVASEPSVAPSAHAAHTTEIAAEEPPVKRRRRTKSKSEVAAVPVTEPTPAATPVKRRRRTTAKTDAPATPETEAVAEVAPTKRRRRTAAEIAEAVNAKTPRRSKPKAAQPAAVEPAMTPEERLEVALEVAEIAAAL